MFFRSRFAFLGFAFVVALVACSGGGGGPLSSGPNAPTNPPPNGSDQVSLSDVGAPQALTPVAGYNETITVPHNSAGGGSLTVISSLSQPTGTANVPANFYVQTAMLYFSITPSSNVTFSGSPSFSIVAPSSVQFNGAPVEFAYFDPATGWRTLAKGSVSGQTIAMTSVSGNFTMQAGQTYAVLVYSPDSVSGCPTPTPTARSSPTPTPTPIVKPTPTPTPTKPTPAPSPTGTGMTACTAKGSAVPGDYLALFTEGNISGSTYTATDGDYEVLYYSVPTPTPSPTTTPVPTPTPPTPTPVPTPTSTPLTITLYYGEYVWPKFTGTAFGGSEYLVPADSGCFTMILEHVSTTPNTTGFGEPKPPTTPYQTTTLDEGPLTSTTITGISSTSGTGTFAFKTTGADAQAVSGTLTITGSETFTVDATSAIVRRWASLKQQAEEKRPPGGV
jgi:hypothetical protein